MSREDIEKLIGGYGAGILTPEEEQALFAAALEDQALFDALAREQPLRDLLQDPAARASLLAELADRPMPWRHRMAAWLMRPRALTAVAAVLCLVITLTVWETRHRRPGPVLTAHVAPMAPVPAPELKAVPEAAPPPSVPKGRAAAVVKRKPEMEGPPGVPTADTALAETPSAKKTPAVVDELTTGAVAGAPQTLGQLTPAPAPAAAPPPPAPQFQAVAAAEPLAAPAASPLQWSVLRRQPDGEFVRADAANLQTGDAVKLQLESKAAGYVYVVEKQKVLASSRLEPGKPFEAAIEPQGPGRRDLQLWFSRYPMAWPTTGPARLQMSRMSAGMQAVSGVEAPKAANAPAGSGGASPAGPVSIAITLNYQ